MTTYLAVVATIAVIAQILRLWLAYQDFIRRWHNPLTQRSK